MPTPAQNRATVKYRKNHVRTFALQCNKDKDADVIAYLEGCGNVCAELKRLVRDELGRAAADGAGEGPSCGGVAFDALSEKASLRARRESLGLTLDEAAAQFSVESVAVKRWEDPAKPQRAPEGYLDLLRRLEAAAASALERALAAYKLSVPDSDAGAVPVCLTYWRSQAERDAVRADGLPYAVANAVSRELYSILSDDGVDVYFDYRD